MTASEVPETKYQAVKESHVVPRAYLKAWTDEGNVACVHPIKPPPGAPADTLPRPRKKGVGGIAVRPFFYARERPSGETFHDIEWSLGQGENAIAPLLRRIRELWPLSSEDKGAVAELLALQAVRVPRELARLDAIVEAGLQAFAQRSDFPAGEDVVEGRLTEAALSQLRDQFTGSTHRMTRMLKHARMGTTVVGSMQWSLVEFDDELLVTSDHPVHMWPLDHRSLRPRSAPSPGIFETLEIRWALGPSLALLATWRDIGDPSETISGATQLAASLNTCVIAQAEEQWLHKSDVTPPRRGADDLVNSWSPHLCSDYNSAVARRSKRRRQAGELLAQMRGATTPPPDASIAFIPPQG